MVYELFKFDNNEKVFLFYFNNDGEQHKIKKGKFNFNFRKFLRFIITDIKKLPLI